MSLCPVMPVLKCSCVQKVMKCNSTSYQCSSYHPLNSACIQSNMDEESRIDETEIVRSSISGKQQHSLQQVCRPVGCIGRCGWVVCCINKPASGRLGADAAEKHQFLPQSGQTRYPSFERKTQSHLRDRETRCREREGEREKR